MWPKRRNPQARTQETRASHRRGQSTSPPCTNLRNEFKATWPYVGIPEQLKSIPAYLGKPLNDLVCWCSAPSLGKWVQRHMTEASESPRPNAGNESRPSPRPVYEPPLPELEKWVQSHMTVRRNPQEHEAHTGQPKFSLAENRGVAGRRQPQRG